jgi:fatty acid desaturase
MSRMTENQRMQFERPDLRAPDVSVRTRSDRPLVIYTVVALAVLGALGWAAVERIDGWPQVVVLAAIVLTAVGMIIAVDPMRRS